MRSVQLYHGKEMSLKPADECRQRLVLITRFTSQTVSNSRPVNGETVAKLMQVGVGGLFRGKKNAPKNNVSKIL